MSNNLCNVSLLSLLYLDVVFYPPRLLSSNISTDI